MLLIFLLLLAFQQTNSQNNDPFRLSPPKETNHLVHFSNKSGTFWVGETRKETRHFLMGLISYRERLFSDYQITLGKEVLKRESASIIEYYPWQLNRIYFKGIKEQVFMPDSYDGMAILIQASQNEDVEYEFYGDEFLEIVRVDSNSTPNRITLKTAKKVNAFITFASENPIQAAELKNGDLWIKTRQKHRPNHDPQGIKEIEQLLTIGLGNTEEEAQRTVIIIMSNYESLLAQKRMRIQSLVQQIDFKSANPDLDRSLRWALASFDALNINEVRTELGKGIYAGYPWFQDYWGRDSFIALRALTVTGQFELAKENLLSFLKYQVQDSTDTHYGKIPNRVRPDESIYNTADATPRFIIEAWVYYQFSGDYEFLKQVLPYVRHAIKGTITYRTDKLGFLVHGEADTWMDAVGPQGPYSPRGNRANDIQALWIQALDAANQLAWHVRNEQELASLTEIWREKVKVAFKDKFLSRGKAKPVVYDAIDSTGNPSSQIRVNQLFTLPVIEEPLVKAALLNQVMSELGTPFGPLSLSTKDEWFHPYHKLEPVYEQDASYHNGIIWVWNSGDFVGSLMKYGHAEKGMEIINNYSKRILQDVSLGTLPELYDAIPRHSSWSRTYPDVNEFKNISRFDQMTLRNEAGFDVEKYPAASGTFSQAWSLSEYIRMLTEHLIGLELRGKHWVIRPHTTKALPQFSLTIYIQQATLRLEVEESEYRLNIKNEGNNLSFSVAVPSSPDVMEFEAEKGETQVIINVFEQTGMRKDGSKMRLNRKVRFFADEEAVKEELRKLKWPDFSKIELELRDYKSQLDKK